MRSVCLLAAATALFTAQAALADERVTVSETGSNNYSYVSVIHDGSSTRVTSIARAGQGSVTNTYTLGNSSPEVSLTQNASSSAAMRDRLRNRHWFRGWQRIAQAGS
jgi:hypothetical protein